MILRLLASSILNSNLHSQPSLRNVLRRSIFVNLFYTQTTSPAAHGDLFRRISRAGSSTISIVPLLDRWVNEGRNVSQAQLRIYIKEMRRHKRYSHALQISIWMTDSRSLHLSRGDAAIRLDLISKVHGVEEAEKYFHDIPENLRGLEAYNALLNCYVNVKSVDKAEAIMQKMKDLGLATKCLAYNSLLNLYYKTRNFEKLDPLMHEMERKVGWDSFTYGIRLSAYAAVSDIEGIGKTLERMESSSIDARKWVSYSIAANAYTKAGLVDKAFAMLRKVEELALGANPNNEAYDYLLTQYGAAGMKEDVLRIWELYKQKKNIRNSGYVSIIMSLLKLDDIENAEKIYEEWESRNLTFDLRIPKYLIGAYSRRGLMEKAEAIKERIALQGQKPDKWTCFHISKGHFQNNETGKAVEALKEAIVVSKPGWNPGKVVLGACMQYVDEKGDFDEKLRFINLLKDKGIVPEDVHKKLINNDKETPGSLIPEELEADSSSAQSEVMFEHSDAEKDETSSEQSTDHLLAKVWKKFIFSGSLSKAKH